MKRPRAGSGRLQSSTHSKPLFATQFRRKSRRPWNEIGSDDDDDLVLPKVVPAREAFNVLLGSLAQGSKAGSKAIRQRLREQAGDSDDSSSEPEDREESRGRREVLPPAANASKPTAAFARCGDEPMSTPGTALDSDLFEDHLSRELTEDDVAELAGDRPRPQAVSWEGDWADTWKPDATIREQRGASSSSSPLMLPRLRDYGVKERCITRWREAVGEQLRKETDFVSREQQAVFAALAGYRDLVYPLYKYPERAGQCGASAGCSAEDPVLDAVLLHVVNHVAKSADRVRKNNADADAAREEGRPIEEIPRDQGFVRPRALLLLPTRNMARTVAWRLMTLAQKRTRTDTYQGVERLNKEFGDGEEVEDKPRKGGAKPLEHQALFAGNCDDFFRLGVRITRGSVRLLFRDMLEADVVIASPVAVAASLEEALKAPGEGKADWLSSVEVLAVVRADFLSMQNWRHVTTAVGALNRLPETQHCDIMRVREWALAGQGAHFRQTVVLTSFESAEVAAMVAQSCRNHAGCLRIEPSHPGVLSRLPAGAQIMFDGVESGSPEDAPDARFEYFQRKVWPRMRDTVTKGQLIFVQSYFDYLRLRKFFREQDTEVALASEYEDKSGFTRARTLFFQGRRRFLLYTERAHFYHRFRLRGVRDVFFYSVPEHAEYFSEIAGLMEGGQGEGGLVRTLFTKWDALQMRRIVGTSRAGKMIKAGPKAFVFG